MASNALIKRIVELLEDTAKCAICTQILKSARSLPCSHSFCLHCLQGYGMHKKPGEELNCSLCGEHFKIPAGGFVELSATPFINILVEVLSIQGKNEENYRHQCSDPCWSCLIDNPMTCQSMLAGGSNIQGMALVGEELFIVRNRSTGVEVYSVYDLTKLLRKIDIPELHCCFGMVYSDQTKRLYVSNQCQSYIFSICIGGTVVKSYQKLKLPEGIPCGLAISNGHDILVSLYNIGRIQECNMNGIVANIQVDKGMCKIFHAIKLKTGEFVVCQFSPEHRICLIDSSGKVISSYGQGRGSAAGQLDHPIYLAADELGNLLVADCHNNKLRVFSSTLEHLGDIRTSGAEVRQPTCFCWDKARKRLIIGENGGNLVTIQQTQ